MRFCATFLGLAFSIVTRHAFAQDTTTTAAVRFSYTANEACPTKDTFSHLVSERGVLLSEDANASRALDVTMDADATQNGKWRGSFRLSSPSNPGSLRTIEGASCAEVAHSLAIFTALALAPITNDASTPPPTEVTPTPPPEVDPTPEKSSQPATESPLLLHRHRFMLEANTRFFKSLSEYENAAGAGISASYFFSDAFALRIDATYLSTVNAITPFSTSPAPTGPVTGAVVVPELDQARAKVMMGPELDALRAHETLMGPHGNPFDIFFRAEIGAIWTRYQLDSTMSYEANPAAEVDVGARLFLTPSVALSLEAGWLMYDDHYRVPSIFAAQSSDLPSSTAQVRMGPIAELGFDVFLPEPK